VRKKNVLILLIRKYVKFVSVKAINVNVRKKKRKGVSNGKNK
jgi:hypothetical protein